jgi:hypothetical protein
MRVGYQKRTIAGDKTICLPVPDGVDYDIWIKDPVGFRQYLDEQIRIHPELFPPAISTGYQLIGFVESKKQQIRTRRLMVKDGSRQCYQIRPDTMMPYMVGTTEEVAKGLDLRRYGVPYEGIARVLGHSPMYWYSATQALGRISIVGSLAKEASVCFPHLVADEKHSWWLGKRIYIAVTAAKGCFLGVGLAKSASTEDLTTAYGEFAQEAYAIKADYCPETVNLDGWEATQAAWQQLFPRVVIMNCFLHFVLGIQQRCRANKNLYKTLTEDLWNLYHSLNPSQFGQRLRRFMEWVEAEIEMPAVILEKVRKLCVQKENFKLTFQHPGAYRTSNQVDRLMNYQDRLLYAMQYFHGSEKAIRQGIRAMAMLWNFHPYSQKVQRKAPYSQSPFEALNGFRYHDHWLRNLIIASSLNGRLTGKSVPLKLEAN